MRSERCRTERSVAERHESWVTVAFRRTSSLYRNIARLVLRTNCFTLDTVIVKKGQMSQHSNLCHHHRHCGNCHQWWYLCQHHHISMFVRGRATLTLGTSVLKKQVCQSPTERQATKWHMTRRQVIQWHFQRCQTCLMYRTQWHMLRRQRCTVVENHSQTHASSHHRQAYISACLCHKMAPQGQTSLAFALCLTDVSRRLWL